MLFLKNPPFTNVVGTGTATLNLPVGMSYNKIMLHMAGTSFGRSNIKEIRLRLNGKVIFTSSGVQLDLLNKYRGKISEASFLVIDFTEARAKNMPEEFIGNINTARGVSSFVMEVDISGASSPVLESYSELAPPAPLGVISKRLQFSAVFGASGKFPFKLIDVANRGAIIKRIHFVHTGGVDAVEVKKNGVVIHDNVNKTVNEFYQKENGKAPQTNVYTYDPCLDDNYSNALTTEDAMSLEFNVVTNRADTVTAVMEVLDLLGNM